MASGKHKISAPVSRPAVNIFEKADVMAHFDQGWKTARAGGVITAKGAQQSWVVKWMMGALEKVSEHCGKAIPVVGGQSAPLAPNGAAAVGGAAPVPDTPPSPQSESSGSNSDMSISEESDAAAGEEEEEIEPSDPQNPLHAHGLVWTEKPYGVTEDYRAAKHPARYDGSIIWPRTLHHEGVKNERKLDYFLLMFPQELQDFCDWTSAKIPGNPLTKHEFIKFFGVVIAIPIASQRSRRECWGTEDIGLLPPLEFRRRFGMLHT